MNILLTGASGFIGRHILQVLQQQDHKVIACCRNPEKLFFCSASTKPQHLDFADIMTEADCVPYLQDIDVLINCVGIIAETGRQTFQQLHAQAPIALFRAAEQAGVKKIIQISALGADQHATSQYHKSKKSADDALRSLSVQWMVLQPSIVYGEGAQSMALFHALAAMPMHMLIDGGEQHIQPVHVADLVATLMQCLKKTSLTRQTIALVGSEAISFKQLLQQLRRRLGKKPALQMSLPGNLVKHLSFIGKVLHEPIFNADSITMLQHGNTANVQPVSDFLGRCTRNLQDTLLLKPASQAERWHASLYFLRPLLRLTIAFVWLWSGIVALFFYPHEQSYQLLAACGMTGNAAVVMLFGLAFMDILLGVASLVSFQVSRLIPIQLLIIFLYTLVISYALPEFWLHPFGPILKNMPLFISLLVYWQLEGERP